MILYVLGGIVAGLAALLFPQSTSFLAANVRIACKQVSHCVVSSIVNDSGLLKKLSPINTQGCNVIRSPFLNGCEDMHLVGSKLVLCNIPILHRSQRDLHFNMHWDLFSLCGRLGGKTCLFPSDRQERHDCFLAWPNRSL